MMKNELKKVVVTINTEVANDGKLEALQTLMKEDGRYEPIFVVADEYFDVSVMYLTDYIDSLFQKNDKE